MSDDTGSKLSQITMESATVEFGGQEFEIKPLENQEFLRLTATERAKQKGNDQIVLDIVTAILQKDDESITKEEVAESPPGLIATVMEEMEQVNGLEDFIEM